MRANQERDLSSGETREGCSAKDVLPSTPSESKQTVLKIDVLVDVARIIRWGSVLITSLIFVGAVGLPHPGAALPGTTISSCGQQLQVQEVVAPISEAGA
jgi:hypothetical protein